MLVLAARVNGKRRQYLVVKCRMFERRFRTDRDWWNQLTGYWGRSERFGRVDDIVQFEPSPSGGGDLTHAAM